MKKLKVKENTHFVIKKDDTMQYLNRLQKVALRDVLDTISKSRKKDNKKNNEYLIINKDEPYANKVFEVIKQGEIHKEVKK
jgi:hypothetical protein